MLFNLDTDDYEAIKIDITEKDEEKELGEIVSEFCYAIASFFIDFSTKLNAKNKEQIDVLKDVCSSCIDNYIDIIANEVLVIRRHQETKACLTFCASFRMQTFPRKR